MSLYLLMLVRRFGADRVLLACWTAQHRRPILSKRGRHAWHMFQLARRIDNVSVA